MARIDRLFDELLTQKGSDLHLGVGMPPMIRARGELAMLRPDPIDDAEMQSLLFEILSPQQREKIEGELDLDFAYAYADKARFRANYFYKVGMGQSATRPALGAVFRTIPTKVLTLEDLKTPDVVRRISDRKQGLVLVTGPTGSGKSTTLAAMIDHINKTRAAHVLTIEDPVEFVHTSQKSQITHREVGIHASSFGAAMRSAGREDPNVILVGELRTNETMKLAVQLASFGVLVFATVHTNSAAATIDRIINAFPAEEQPQVRGMLAEGLVAIVAQQLLKTADGKGRVAALEILIGSSAVSAMIRDGKTFQIPSLMQSGQAQGMQTMDMAIERFLVSKTVSPEVALEKATDKELIGRVIQRLKDAAAAP